MTEQWKRLSDAEAEAMVQRYERCYDMMLQQFRMRELDVAEEHWYRLYPTLPSANAEKWLRNLEDAVLNGTKFTGKSDG
jgi:hypothetical protein